MFKLTSSAKCDDFMSDFGNAFKLFTPFDAYKAYKTDKGIVLEIDLPGVKADDVNISVQGNGKLIDIFAEGKRFDGSKREFKEQWRLEEPVDEDKIDATLKDGVLILTLIKLDKLKREKKKIPIKT